MPLNGAPFLYIGLNPSGRTPLRTFMNRYRAGRAKEYAARKDLERRGAYVVRSAGSKGCIDLVAIFPEAIWLVQVKYGARSGQWWRDANWGKLLALPTLKRVWRTAYIYRRGNPVPEIEQVMS